jgi:hypothetical protein
MSSTILDPNVIDDAKAHFLRGFEIMLPLQQAYLHVGMFLGWVIDRGLYSEFFREETETQMRRFQSGSISCIILGEIWDGIVSYEQLSAEAQAFARSYYASGMYLQDYRKTLAQKKQSIYQVEDTPANYQTMRAQLDLRYAEWTKKRAFS